MKHEVFEKKPPSLLLAAIVVGLFSLFVAGVLSGASAASDKMGAAWVFTALGAIIAAGIFYSTRQAWFFGAWQAIKYAERLIENEVLDRQTKRLKEMWDEIRRDA